MKTSNLRHLFALCKILRKLDCTECDENTKFSRLKSKWDNVFFFTQNIRMRKNAKTFIRNLCLLQSVIGPELFFIYWHVARYRSVTLTMTGHTTDLRVTMPRDMDQCQSPHCAPTRLTFIPDLGSQYRNNFFKNYTFLVKLKKNHSKRTVCTILN